MRKIIIFSLAYYPKYVAGAEVAIKEITDRISPEEIVFDVITIGDESETRMEKIGNVRVHRILKGMNTVNKLLFPFVAYKKALKLHKENKYDAVWAMMASYAGFSAFLFKKKNPSIPFILTLQEGGNFTRREGVFSYGFKKIFLYADYISVISKFLADWAMHMGAKCPIVIVPNAVDFNLFSTRRAESELKSLKDNLGKRDGDVFLITTSRLEKKNATKDVIEALRSLPENVKFLVLGQGTEEKMLKSLSKKLNLENRVRFLGFIPHSDMPSYLHVSDIFIRPSLSEGFGLSFVEAMAAGIPVIAPPVGGIVDFLLDGETGLFCEVANPRSIVQKVEKLIRDKESRDYIVNNAYKMVKEKYDWGMIAKDMKDKVFLRAI